MGVAWVQTKASKLLAGGWAELARVALPQASKRFLA